MDNWVMETTSELTVIIILLIMLTFGLVQIITSI